MATNGSFNQQDQYKGAEQYPATSGPADSSNGTASGNADLSKDEVGWYFVEQYYTTLSKSPEKLHLFYGKRSQFVSGLEAEVAPVSVGRNAIQERIRDLDFQDCKVRVSNVDSQASFDNIVIQVIGETSNKSGQPRKFVQTFVLAQQPTGYFVLNDIFRYINEEGDEEPAEAQEEAPLTEDVEMPKQTVEEPAAPLDADVVDKKLEEVEEAPVNGEDVVEAEEAPVAATKTEEELEVPTPEVAEKAVEEESKETEKPQEPVPTPVVQTPAAPPKPLSWANRAAAAAAVTPKPAVPSVLPKTSTPPAQARAPPKSQTAPVIAPATAPATAPSEKENKPPSEWQTAGNESKRQNRPQSISAPVEKEGNLGYVKNVTEKVVAEELKAALASFGEVVYFDVNRTKNCAFVEFATAEGYQAAAKANPHVIGGESIFVEPRRPKAGAYGGNGYSGGRGGAARGGRGGFEQRPGNQGRGNFGQNRGRGGGGAPRGRGASQAAA